MFTLLYHDDPTAGCAYKTRIGYQCSSNNKKDLFLEVFGEKGIFRGFILNLLQHSISSQASRYRSIKIFGLWFYDLHPDTFTKQDKCLTIKTKATKKFVERIVDAVYWKYENNIDAFFIYFNNAYYGTHGYIQCGVFVRHYELGNYIRMAKGWSELASFAEKVCVVSVTLAKVKKSRKKRAMIFPIGVVKKRLQQQHSCLETGVAAYMSALLHHTTATIISSAVVRGGGETNRIEPPALELYRIHHFKM